ncbi:MAG TPA: SprT-like domain-containing protein [Bryobacteraceae bacterium]|nr:SprT-like domain-containing protein [Bryobacteraceae bacterium]
MQVESPGELLFAQEHSEASLRTPQEIYAEVFREMRPRTPMPLIRIKFLRYANASAKIKLEDGVLEVRIADTLAGAPDLVMQALAEILLSKLFRRPVPAHSNERYRRYLNRRDVRRSLDLVRQIRGRKQVEDAQGRHYNLDHIFEELNFQYFHGLMARPVLGWSPNASRTMLGHYDPSHNAIVLSRILDRPQTPRVAVEYVLFHEMLHLRHPAEHRGARRCVHTKAFKEAEKRFERLGEAQDALRRL